MLGCHSNLKFPLTYTVIGKVILALISVSLLTADISTNVLQKCSWSSLLYRLYHRRRKRRGEGGLEGGGGGGGGGGRPPNNLRGGPTYPLAPPPPNNPPICTGKTIPLNSILEFSIIYYFKMRNVIIWH